MVAAGVLISGAGTNLQAIIDRISAGRLACTLRVVISNRPGVPGLGRAERAGVPTRVISHQSFSGREEFDRAILTALREAEVELVLLAGFDRLITRTLIEAFPLRIMNIHPALLPAFKGLEAQAAARAYGVKVAGATVHFVDEQPDHGPIILQGAVPIGPDDTEAEVRDRIRAVEHEIYPTAIQFFAEGLLEVKDRRVLVRGVRPPVGPPLISW